eukprot:320205_1
MSAKYKPKSNLYYVGDYVLLGNREGYVRYIGKREHNHGLWYGIELIVGDGPNDGSEHGHRYFSCKAKRGVFVKHFAIKKKLNKRAKDPRRILLQKR